MAAAAPRRARSATPGGRTSLAARSRRAEYRQLLFNGTTVTFGAGNFLFRGKDNALEIVMAPPALILVNRHLPYLRAAPSLRAWLVTARLSALGLVFFRFSHFARNAFARNRFQGGYLQAVTAKPH